MSLFEKLKTAVLGNPVLKEYELGKHVCSAGPGLLWRVHDGVKKTTRQEVSLFVFFKKVPTFEKLPKKERVAIIEMMKRGPTHLIKLRHPQLLRVEHAMVESSDCIVFVTEPVFCSLANVLGNYENVPTPLPLCIKEHQFHPVEVKYGLLQLAEGLSFLHNDAKLFHGNLTPEIVIINHKGEWKLGGFHFCCYTQYTTSAQTTFKFQEYDTDKPLHTQPNLDYLAPEYILEKSCTTQSDMYSMGMLIYALYNQGRALFENRNNLLSYKSNVEQVSRATNSMLGEVPEEIKDSVRAMLSMEPSVRIEALQMTKASFFDDPLITALHTLDGLCKQPDIVKSQFYKSLHLTITQLPRRIVVQKVFPVLAAEFHNNIMIPFVLPNVLLIAEESSIQEYSTLILPTLRPVFTVQNPVQDGPPEEAKACKGVFVSQVMLLSEWDKLSTEKSSVTVTCEVPLILLHRMDLLLKKSTPSEVKEHLLPMIIGALNSSDHDVQERCVTVLPSFAASIDYTSFKHSIIPLIMSLCINTPHLSVKVKSLVSIGSMLDISVDKHILLKQIMPTIYKMDDCQPAVLMAILGICHGALQRQKLGFDKDYLATKVLPFLIPKSTQPTLNVSQFNKFMTIIKDMMNKIQTDHKEFLEHNEKMQEQMRSTVQFSEDVKEAKKVADVTSGIEAMSNPNQEVSVSARRGATVSSPPSTGVGTTASNSEAHWMSSLSGVSVTTAPVQPQSTSTAAGSLFAGLSFNDKTQAPSLSSSLMTSASSKPPESVTNTNMLSQSVSVTHNQPVANVSRAARASSNTAQPAPGILQPQSSSVVQSQPSSDANVPVINAMPTHLPNSTMLQPQPMTSLYNNTASKPQTGMTYQPPPIIPAAKTISSSMTEEPPPYPGHDNYSAAASNFRTGTQQVSGLSQSTTLSSSASSVRTNVLQPQTPNVLQPSKPVFNPQVVSLNDNMLQPQQPNMLQPQQPNMLPSAQPISNAVKPHISGIQMHSQAPVVTMQSSGDPRGHSSVTAAMLLPQHPSIVSSTPAAGFGHTGMNAATTGLSQQPLIATPSATTPQGSHYKMAPGNNPFSDIINDLL